MRLEHYQDIQGFSAHVATFLLEHEAEHNLLLGILDTLRHNPQHYSEQPAYLACVHDDQDQLVAVALRTPPHGLVLSQCRHLEALPLIIHDIRDMVLPSVLAPKILARPFAQLWQQHSGAAHSLMLAERIYKLEQVRPVRGIDGHLRRASQEDRAVLIEFMEAFQREALAHTPHLSAADSVDKRLSRQQLFVWEQEGRIVSLAGIAGYTPNGARIGPVYTPTTERGHGYASAAVAALSQRLLESGKRFCFLFTDLANPTSNHIYQNIGYQPVIDVDMYRFIPAAQTSAAPAA